MSLVFVLRVQRLAAGDEAVRKPMKESDSRPAGKGSGLGVIFEKVQGRSKSKSIHIHID